MLVVPYLEPSLTPPFPAGIVRIHCVDVCFAMCSNSTKATAMKFDALDKKMRVFETAADQCVLPGVFMAPQTGIRPWSTE